MNSMGNVRLLLVALGALVGVRESAKADEFIFRLEVTGYLDRPDSEDQPQVKILASMELLVTPEQRFHARAKLAGGGNLFVSGSLKRRKEADSHLIDIDFRYDQGDENRRLEAQTVVALKLGQRQVIGGSESRTSDGQGATTKSKTAIAVQLAEFANDCR